MPFNLGIKVVHQRLQVRREDGGCDGYAIRMLKGRG
jgi:hypothetical protein